MPPAVEHRAVAPPTRQPETRLTAAGGVLVVLCLTVVGGLLDGLFGVGYGTLTGLMFTGGCVISAAKTRRRDLLPLTVTPPLLFAVAIVIAETLRNWGSGNWFRNEVVAVTMTLAGSAVWIALGTGATLVIALGRGTLGKDTWKPR